MLHAVCLDVNTHVRAYCGSLVMVATARVVAKEPILSIAITWMVIATARGVGKVPYVLLPVQMTHLDHSANSTVAYVIRERSVIHVQDSAGTVPGI